jgi:hypothetical protein
MNDRTVSPRVRALVRQYTAESEAAAAAAPRMLDARGLATLAALGVDVEKLQVAEFRIAVLLDMRARILAGRFVRRRTTSHSGRAGALDNEDLM